MRSAEPWRSHSQRHQVPSCAQPPPLTRAAGSSPWRRRPRTAEGRGQRQQIGELLRPRAQVSAQSRRTRDGVQGSHPGPPRLSCSPQPPGAGLQFPAVPVGPRRPGRATMGPRFSVWLLLLLVALLLHEERSRAAAKVSPLRASLPSLPPCTHGAPRGLFVPRPARTTHPALEGVPGGTARCNLPAGLRSWSLWAAIAHPLRNLLCYGLGTGELGLKLRAHPRWGEGAWEPGRFEPSSPRRSAAGRASGSGLEGWARTPHAAQSPTHMCRGNRFGRVSGCLEDSDGRGRAALGRLPGNICIFCFPTAFV